jgi:hypothetical protein
VNVDKKFRGSENVWAGTVGVPILVENFSHLCSSYFRCSPQ